MGHHNDDSVIESFIFPSLCHCKAQTFLGFRFIHGRYIPDCRQGFRFTAMSNGGLIDSLDLRMTVSLKRFRLVDREMYWPVGACCSPRSMRSIITPLATLSVSRLLSYDDPPPKTPLGALTHPRVNSYSCRRCISNLVDNDVSAGLFWEAIVKCLTPRPGRYFLADVCQGATNFTCQES